MSKVIQAVAGDIGGLNAIKSVLSLAIAEGNKVNLYLCATSGRQFTAGSLTVHEQISVCCGALDLPTQNDLTPHDLLIIAASQSDEGSIATANAIYCSSAPCLAVQDYYGSLMPTLIRLERNLGWNDNTVKICVTDTHAKKHLLDQIQKKALIFTGQTIITGGPQFDHIRHCPQGWSADRQKLRAQIGASELDLVFLIVGQLNGTAEAIAMAQEAVTRAEVRDRAIIVTGQHPRHTCLDQIMLDNLKFDPGIRFGNLADSAVSNSEAFLPAADFVLSGYSTTNYHGILHQMIGVIYLGTPSFCHDLHREKNLDKPLEVDIGAAWYAATPAELTTIVTELSKHIAHREWSHAAKQIMFVQAQIAQANDGHAAQRVWAEAKQILDI